MKPTQQNITKSERGDIEFENIDRFLSSAFSVVAGCKIYKISHVQSWVSELTEHSKRYKLKGRLHTFGIIKLESKSIKLKAQINTWCHISSMFSYDVVEYRRRFCRWMHQQCFFWFFLARDTKRHTRYFPETCVQDRRGDISHRLFHPRLQTLRKSSRWAGKLSCGEGWAGTT